MGLMGHAIGKIKGVRKREIVTSKRGVGYRCEGFCKYFVPIRRDVNGDVWDKLNRFTIERKKMGGYAIQRERDRVEVGVWGGFMFPSVF